MKRSLRHLLAALFPLAIVACEQLQGLDSYEKVDCVGDGCDAGSVTPTVDSGGGGTDAGQPDTFQPPTCPPCTDGTVCDSKSLKCVECLPGTKACAPGQFCDPDDTAGYKCVQGCGTVQDCIIALKADAGADGGDGGADAGDGGAGTLACCNNRCVDTSLDGKNCGACNVICGGSAACCDSNCQDIVSTATSCGGCGISCSANHVPLPTCGAKACNGTCETGWADCNMNKLSDGCETPVASDPDKCGGCNVVCSNNNIQTRTCTNGSCSGSCKTGFLDCNKNKQLDGCEVNIGTDPANCGDCDKACSNNNIPTPACGGGVCNGACAAGYSDCDGSKLVNGCETKTSGAGADPDNCGGCGAAFKCSSNNITTRACNGTCTGACNANYGDCNANKLTDGCETLINGAGADPNHCGACNSPCSSNHMATRTCNGTCTGTCDVGYGDCNNDKKTDGCETRTDSDSLKCGGACTPCAAGSRACVGGVCQAGTTYGATASSSAFVDACAQAGAQTYLSAVTDDDVTTPVLTIPFSFTFYGTAYTQFSISSNGFIGFGATAVSSSHYGGECPLAVPSVGMPVLWVFNADLLPRAGNGVCVATIGAAGARRTIVTWKNARFYSSSGGTADILTFSAFLNEGTNTVDVVYQQLDNGSGGASLTDSVVSGIQNTDGTQQYTLSCNQTGIIATGTKIRYFF